MRPGPYAGLIAAMRADAVVAPQERHLWQIKRVAHTPEAFGRSHHLYVWHRIEYGYDRYPDLPAHTTCLYRWTDATLHQDHGECVMSDDPRELRKHLPILLNASGRVLVTGLGLGCVVRGLLACRSRVTHIDVVEIDRDILDMVAAEFAGIPWLTIHHGDALTIDWPAGTKWDFAWHDIWHEKPDTQVLHAQLLARYESMAGAQGAWGFPRYMKRAWPRRLIGAAA